VAKIEKLQPEIINQIAAGEVVERPSHLVKELIENAVDAGATEISVEFDLGGRYVKISDNGFGISKEDLSLALAPHATSKIKTVHDIWNLNSFGFRGEALASIASVSKLSLVSRVKEAQEAYRIESDFGKISEVQSVGGEFGTTIVVKDLFENIPARLKFLKSDAAEHTQIKNVVKAMGLAHPEVCFRVRGQAKLLYFWEAVKDKKLRVQQVLEQDHLYQATGSYEDFHVEIYMSAPNNTVRTSKQMWFFVQNRWVQDRGMQAAVMDAYRNLLMHREYPIVACWLEAPLDEVDVNIHPTKSKIKFNQPSNSYRVVNRAVRAQLEKAPWLDEFLGNSAMSDGDAAVGSQPALNYEEPPNTIRSINSPQASLLVEDTEGAAYAFHDHSKSLQFKDSALDKIQYEQKNIIPANTQGQYEEPVVEKNQSSAHWGNLQVIGQADLTYIVTQSASSLVLVDQHAAHERVAFEKLMFAWKEGRIDVQQMLIPLTFQFDEEMVEALVTKIEDLKRLGIFMEQMGADTVAISAHPQLLKPKAIQWSLESLAKEVLDKGDGFSVEKMIGDLCATLACHSVIRAGKALSHAEMEDLLKQMDEFPLSSFCPHGRPVYVEYEFSKIEKNFGRIV
jgi:DNA mismatch repair protein MutL